MEYLLEYFKDFPSEKECIKHLEKIRWGDKPICPYCQSKKTCPHNIKNRRQNWHCCNCHKSFSVTVGTIFHKTRIPIQKWFLLIFLLNTKAKLSHYRISYHLKVRIYIAYNMIDKIKTKCNIDDTKIITEIFNEVKKYLK